MTIGDHKYLLEESVTFGRDSAPGIDDGTLTLHINEALQFAYPFALKAFPEFYAASDAFANTTTITLPADYSATLLIEVPTRQSDAAATSKGAAKIVGHREFLNLQNTAHQAGTEDQPIALVESSGIKIAPTCAGTHYYLRSFGYITDDAYDIAAFGVPGKPPLIPWVFEQLVIQQAKFLAVSRELMRADLPAALSQQYMQIKADAKTALEKQMEPYRVFQREIATSGGVK